jgi:hypothetical protein
MDSVKIEKWPPADAAVDKKLQPATPGNLY